jgi:4-hydroxy-L-threonine phosphate dehydrogenase PdxA
MSDSKPRVGITQGDMNGIGPETIIKALSDPAILELITPVIYSSSKVITAHRKTIGNEEFALHIVKSGEPLNGKKVNLIQCFEAEDEVEFGKPSAASGKLALQSVDAAIEDIKRGYIDVFVTAPVDKHAVAMALPGFTGHTGYIRSKFNASDVLMLLLNGNMRIGLVTEHLPLRDVASAVTTDRIVAKGKIMAKSLLEDFGIRKPRIAVLGLNPHEANSATKKKQSFSLQWNNSPMRVFSLSALIPLTDSSAPATGQSSTASSPCITIKVSHHSKHWRFPPV